MNLTLADYIRGVKDWSLDTEKVVYHYLEKAKRDENNARLRFHEDYMSEHIADFSSRWLCAAPIAIKDNILVEWTVSTCASKIMKDYVAPYTAGCIKNLESSGGLMIGKTNMDEFAMWASTEHSAYGNTLHPLDPSRIPGGSSWWSATAVATDQCIAALWTETWWSVRQPAALCGLVWVKPSYGSISRYGVQAMAASINQVGTITKTVEDAVILYDAVTAYDERDAKSIDRSADTSARYEQLWRERLDGVKIAVPHQFMGDTLDSEIKGVCVQALARLEELGAEVSYIDLPILNYVVPTYYIIVPAEVSADMARFDGIRFGLQDDTMKYDNIYDYYASIRHDGFGDEVKRRIIVWSYVLSAGFYDAYYHKAQQVLKKMKSELAKVYKDFDAIIWPTTPSLARKLGEKIDDPVQMYLEDVYTCVANLTGLPAMSIPIWSLPKDGVDLPVGLQIMTGMCDEASMFGIGHQLEKVIGYRGK